MKLEQLDKNKLLGLLNNLSGALEELLLSGLTTASESTRQTFAISAQEAPRMGLSRLGGSLRLANEELGRYTRNDNNFSQKRFSFFLSRSWLITQGVMRAIKENDQQEFDRLVWVPTGKPVSKSLQLVTVGVAKKVVTNTFCAFDFRLRMLDAIDGVGDRGTKLIWSCVFPVKPGNEIPAEGFLHLPQKQKFNPSAFLDGKVITIEKALVATDNNAKLGRISLAEDATVTVGAAHEEWNEFFSWDPSSALERIRAVTPGPLDLDIEMQEEVVFTKWELGDIPSPTPGDSSPLMVPLIAPPLTCMAVVSTGVEGEALLKNLKELKKKKTRPPIYGLLHYEKCKLMFQPLSVFPDGKPPQYLMLSEDKIDRAVLLRALKF